MNHELKKVMEVLGYEKTDLHCKNSFIYDASFYKSKYDNVFITDYDIKNDKLLIDTCIVFNSKTGEYFKVSIEFIFQNQFYFKKKLISIKN